VLTKDKVTQCKVNYCIITNDIMAQGILIDLGVDWTNSNITAPTEMRGIIHGSLHCHLDFPTV